MSRPAASRPVGRIRIRLVLVALTSAALSVVVAPAPAGAADGALDPTYGVDGEAGLGSGPWVQGHAAAARPDGGLVVVGRQGPGEDGRGAWALWGVTGGGTSDPQWGEGGLVTHVVGEDGGTAEAVAVQDDGGVVVGGNGSVGGQSHAFLARFTAAGAIDTSFGDGGVRDLGPGGVRSVALREDGSVVAAGFTWLSTSWGGAYAAVRVSVVDEHGGLVDEFGDGGQATQVLGSENADSVGEGVLVRPDGSLWVTGSAWWDPDEAVDVLLARFSSSGALQGAVRTPLGDASSREAAGLDIAAGPDGTAVVSGGADGATNDQLAVLRYTAEGELDPAFGTKGVTLTSLGADTAEGRAVVVDDAGTVLVGGWTEGGSGGQFALARFTPTGQPDTGFGDGGRVRQPLSSTWSRAGGLVVDSENRAVLAGYTGGRFAAARFTGAFPSAVAPPPAASIGDATVAEGGSGTTGATLPVSLDRAPTTSVSVGWATSDGTATAPADYQATSGTVTFAAGQQTAQVTVPVRGDTVDEPDETVLVDLSAPSGLTVTDGHAVLTVTDDDPPASTPPAASVGTPTTVDEGQALRFPVNLDHPGTVEARVRLSTKDGTATAGSDYTSRSLETVTIPAGQTTAFFDVQTIDDPLVEPDETVVVEIRGGANISLGSPSSATGTIHSTDVPPPAASLGTPTAVDEGHALQFPVTLSRAQNVTSTVRLSTKDGTATAGSDYTSRSLETVTIPAGQTTASFDVQTIDDPLVEPDETVIVEIRGGANISLGSPSSATGTIHSTDVPPPAASLGTPTAVDEGHALQFPVTLSRAQNVTSTVRLSTQDGTATAGSDYTARSLETVTIPAGQTTASFDVQTTDDDAIEGDESVKVEIRGGSNISLGSPSSATGLIRDPAVAHVGQTLITRPVSGTVRFRLPGEPDWFPLEGPVTLPVGAHVDATDGAVTLTFAQPARRTSERRGTVSTTQLVTVSGSEVALSQPRRSGRPELRLTGDALVGCPRPGLATTLEVVSRDPVGLQGRIASATLHHGTVRMTDRCRRAKVAVPAGRAAAWRSGHRRGTVRTLRAGDVAVFRRR